jgi:hypothetical protein
LIIISIIKLIHLLIFFVTGDHCLTLASGSISKPTSKQNDIEESPTIRIRYPSLKYRLWLGLGLNSFTCGLMLGTIIYHLVPHV